MTFFEPNFPSLVLTPWVGFHHGQTRSSPRPAPLPPYPTQSPPSSPLKSPSPSPTHLPLPTPIIPPLFSYLVYSPKDMENDAKRLADKVVHAKDALVEGAIEFKEEEVKSGGGAKAFVAGGFGGICTVLVGEY